MTHRSHTQTLAGNLRCRSVDSPQCAEGDMVSARTRMVVYWMSSALAVRKLSLDSRKKLDAMVGTLSATVICRQPSNGLR
jgi:hypothetical protein